ncbi:preprotein translocase subunit SecE [Jongsikchunia kroppenstedtii]|uniref:preprotein translocase subunit SecE n=1 Tax=Jongsikchunia kroppenstedtii TaxID=1121721 RepID=UPI0003A8F185|nr:preprotein translocase subunit SecE [Jongsikchunia kroppenstedtii]
MSKRDRAAKAKANGSSDADDFNIDDEILGDEAELEGALSDDKDLSTKPARPSGKRAARGGRSTLTTEPAVGADKAKKNKGKQSEGRPNPFMRIWAFLLEVLGELKKVIWPTRKEMIQYTIVVLVFMIIVTALVAGLDVGFAKLVLWLFG